MEQKLYFSLHCCFTHNLYKLIFLKRHENKQKNGSHNQGKDNNKRPTEDDLFIRPCQEHEYNYYKYMRTYTRKYGYNGYRYIVFQEINRNIKKKQICFRT